MQLPAPLMHQPEGGGGGGETRLVVVGVVLCGEEEGTSVISAKVDFSHPASILLLLLGTIRSSIHL